MRISELFCCRSSRALTFTASCPNDTAASAAICADNDFGVFRAYSRVAPIKALNAARKEYKEKLAQLTAEYAESLDRLKRAFELGTKDIQRVLATAEESYEKALKEFNAAHPEGYHVTLRDGDFETTLSKQVSNNKTCEVPKTSDIFDIFDWMFRI